MKIKDENLSKSAESSSDFTDNQMATTLCIFPLYKPIYIYNKVRLKLIHL